MFDYYIINAGDLHLLDGTICIPTSTAMPTHAPPSPDPDTKPPMHPHTDPILLKPRALPAKRRRPSPPDESGDSSSHPPRKHRDGPKKKKATRACAHCQKAHLTCDDCPFPLPLLYVRSPPSTARPCQRCIKRGMAGSCVEGHRKKAKYLLDDDELGPSPSLTHSSLS